MSKGSAGQHSCSGIRGAVAEFRGNCMLVPCRASNNPQTRIEVSPPARPGAATGCCKLYLHSALIARLCCLTRNSGEGVSMRARTGTCRRGAGDAAVQTRIGISPGRQSTHATYCDPLVQRCNPLYLMHGDHALTGRMVHQATGTSGSSIRDPERSRCAFARAPRVPAKRACGRHANMPCHGRC